MGNLNVKCLDNIFSYSTVKMVTIKDFRLGLVHKLIQFAIFVYFIVFVLIIEQEYLEKESSAGTALTKIAGVAPVQIYDTPDSPSRYSMNDANGLIIPPNENNAFFVTTKYEETQMQYVGKCVYPDSTCEKDSDCDGMDGTKRVSLENGKCDLSINKCEYEPIYCPVEDPHNVLGNNVTKVYEIDSRNLTIWVKASIMFPKLRSGSVYSTINDPNPISRQENPDMYNLFSLQEILEDGGLKFEDIKKKGAIIGLSIDWTCDLNFWRTQENGCHIKYTAKRMDHPEIKSGMNFRWSYLQDQKDGRVARTVRKYYGVRVLITSKGVGAKISIMQIILQFSSFTALLVIATSVCDALLNSVFSGENKAYLKAKNTETESYIEHRIQKKKFEGKQPTIAETQPILEPINDKKTEEDEISYPSLNAKI